MTVRVFTPGFFIVSLERGIMSHSPDDLNFSIDSRLLEELGENLVTRNHVAVAELIKNAYDADATEVNLKFINSRQDESHSSEIKISDNGSGMTFNEINENWMRIGTTDKIRNPETDEYGRTKTGNKGIGRFSCRRLAHRLELTAIAEDPDSDGYVKTFVEFDWENFARNTDVDEIPVPYEVEYPDEAKTGVTLRLIDLRDEWTERDFNTLRRNVLTLSVIQSQRRDGYKEDPGFEITFDAPEFDKGQGSLQEQVYNAGWCVLEGRFDADGNVNLELDAKKIGERSYTLRKKYSGIGGTSFKIAFIPNQKKHFRDTSTLSWERASDIMDDYAGIRVYKGGFRVYPYGGPNSDWLGIDRYYSRRIGRPEEEFDDFSGKLELHNDYERVMLVHPRNENLIGRVSVDTDANLEMTADREGFIQNDTFEDLKEGVRLSLQWLTLQYSNYQALIEEEKLREEAKELKDQLEEGNTDTDESDNTSKKSSNSGLSEWNSSESGSSGSSQTSTGNSKTKATSSGSSSDSDALNQAVSVIESATENISNNSNDEDDEISDAVETATDIVQTSVEQKQKEIDFYRSAFSVNQFVFSFMHELRDMILELETAKSDIEESASNLPADQRESFNSVTRDLDSLKSRFEQQMDLFGVLTDSGASADKEEHRLETEVENLVNSIDYISTDYNIQIKHDIPVNLYTPPMHETELYSILINLLTNSIKAVIAGASQERDILIEGRKVENDIAITVRDSGVGLPEEYQQEVFDPLITDPGDELYDRLDEEMPENLSSQLGTGSGLGLNIVRDIANKYGGSVEFVEHEEWTTSVEVVLSE